MQRVSAGATTGLKIVGTWSNSAGADFRMSGYSSPYLDVPLPTGHGKLDQIGSLGFNLMSNDLFTNGNAGGTYTVSNFRLDYSTPPAFKIKTVAYVPEFDGLSLTWDSQPGATYVLQFSNDLNAWGDWIFPASIPSQGDTTTFLIEFVEPNTYYRIRKE